MTQADAPSLILSDLRHRRRAEIRNVIAMAIPSVITTSSRAVMDVADFIMITYLPTDRAQAAILPSQMIMWSYTAIGLGIVTMVNTFAAQALGRQQHRECSAYAWQSLYLGIAFGILGAVLIPLVPTVIHLIGLEPSVQTLQIQYLQIALLTPGPTIAAHGLGFFFIGVHRPWITTWSAIEANVVNIAAGIVLIFGYCGFEPMGIAGAAWAMLIALSYRAIRLVAALLAPSVARVFESRSTWRPSWSRMGSLLRVGSPNGFQWSSEVVVWAVFVNLLIGRRFGTADLIATSTAWQYMRLSFLPPTGVGQALTALVGRSIGAGDIRRALREARWANVLTVGYMGLLSVVYTVFGTQLVGLFNRDPNVMTVGGRVMICAAVFQLFDALAITYAGALRGAGDTFVPAIFFVASTWIIILGGGWFMAQTFPQLGSLGPWLAAATLIAVTALFLWWRWNGRAWMKIDLFRARSEPRP